LVASSPFIYKEEDYTFLVGDGVKQAKEGKFACYIRKNIYRFMLKTPDSCITQYIYDKQEEPSNYKDWKFEPVLLRNLSYR
jgi:hypothetical protein